VSCSSNWQTMRTSRKQQLGSRNKR